MDIGPEMDIEDDPVGAEDEKAEKSNEKAAQYVLVLNGYMAVIFNNWYGGYGVSPFIMDTARRFLDALDLEFHVVVDDHSRTVPVILAWLYHSLKLLKQGDADAINRLNQKHSSLEVEWVHLDYRHCIEIDEYDGAEAVRVKPELQWKRLLASSTSPSQAVLDQLRYLAKNNCFMQLHHQCRNTCDRVWFPKEISDIIKTFLGSKYHNPNHLIDFSLFPGDTLEILLLDD
jgi:hypothetical protein